MKTVLFALLILNAGELYSVLPRWGLFDEADLFGNQFDLFVFPPVVFDFLFFEIVSAIGVD